MQFPPRHDELRPHVEALRSLATRLTRDPAHAEDLVQDVMVAYLRRREPLTGELRPWLLAVLRNLHRLSLRTGLHRGRREAASSIQEGEAAELASTMDAERVSSLLHDAIEGLREPYRRTLELSYFEGLSSENVSRALGVPSATIRRRNQLAIAELRRRLNERFRGDREAWRGVLERFAILALPRGFAVETAPTRLGYKPRQP